MPLQEEIENQGIWLFRYRGVLPILLLLVGIFTYTWSIIYPETFFLRNSDYEILYEYLCLSVSIFGLLVRILTVGFTPKNTSGRNVNSQLADQLNTKGIYSLVRHPLYVGNFLMWLGPALLTGHFWFIVAFSFFYWIYYERIMFAEEQFLRGKFDKKYTDWAEKVPAFIPNFKNFKKTELSFSIRKVLKSEKNGLVAIFIIFAFMDLIASYFSQYRDINLVIQNACLLSILLYFVLRYLKRNTKILTEPGR